MTKRLIAVGLLTVVLLALLVLSQMRREPQKVSGFIEADEIRIGSRVGGRVAKVHVSEGDEVTAGKVLVELEPFDLRDQLAQAVAERSIRESERDKLNAGYRPQEVAQAEQQYLRLTAREELLQNSPRKQEIDAAEARLRLANEQLTLAKANFERYQDRFNNKLASQEELDQSLTERRVAEETFEVRRNELKILQDGTRPEELKEIAAQKEEARQAWLLKQEGFRTEERRAAEAAWEAADAAVKMIEARLAELTIQAPIDCQVEAIDLQPGDLVGVSSPVIALADKRRLWIRAYVPENRMALKIGHRVAVSVDSLPGETFAGRVTFVARQGEFRPGNVQTPEERSKQVFRIKVELENGHDKLRPGMVADVWLEKSP